MVYVVDIYNKLVVALIVVSSLSALVAKIDVFSCAERQININESHVGTLNINA
jgi:hypothetical protein